MLNYITSVIYKNLIGSASPAAFVAIYTMQLLWKGVLLEFFSVE